jgi:DUF4097 and DUF4098 domain-containing protein YvlB
MSSRLAFVLLALASVACDVRVNDKGGVSLGIVDGRATDEWSRTYSLAAGGRFELENTNGNIEVLAAAGEQIEVRAERRVRAASDEAAAEILNGLKVEEQVTPELVRIRAPRFERDSFRESVGIQYRVSLPGGTTASLTTQNGNVTLQNVDGRFHAASTNGAIEARGLTGSLEASTVNGGMTVALSSLTGDVTLTTVNGGIRVDLAEGLAARLDASTVNGGVVVSERLPLTGGGRERLRVTGDLNGGGPLIHLQTTNGGIRVGAAGDGARGGGSGESVR